MAGIWTVYGFDLPVATIDSRFGAGAFPSGLPAF